MIVPYQHVSILETTDTLIGSTCGAAKRMAGIRVIHGRRQGGAGVRTVYAFHLNIISQKLNNLPSQPLIILMMMSL